MIRHNDELLLHVELIDVSTGSQLWGEQFKEHYSDVLEDPETLADKICDRLRPILAPTRTAEETNDLDTQRNQAGGAFRVCDGTKSLLPVSPRTPAPRAIMIRCGLKHAFCGKALGLDCHLVKCGRNGRGLLPQLGQIEIQQLRA